VAIDSNLTPSKPEMASVSAIENEFPTYRAISPHAIVSLLFGILALLCFTHWFFLTFAAAAILLGLYADRRIQRLPDVLTGRGLAQAGIALGLVFGLASLTTAAVQDVVLLRESKQFAWTYLAALKEGPIEKALWYHQPPSFRNDKSPAEVVQAIRKSMPDPRMFEMETSELRALKARLASSPQEELHFVRIEKHGLQGLDAYASALLEVHGPGSKASPEKGQFALAVLRGVSKNHKYEWTVESLKFPYKPDSFVPEEEPVDDGHGHGGGGHGHAH
jgi:hypothetical protein